MRRSTASQAVRTPYQDFKAMLVSYHEAGHAVVGHALGWKLLRVRAGRGVNKTSFELVTVQSPFMARSKAEQSRRTAAMRQAMAVLAAGPVAGTIHQKAVEERGFACWAESRAYNAFWELRISTQFPTIPDPDPTSDYAYVVRDATTLCYTNDLFPAMNAVLGNGHADETDDLEEAVSAEILRAEQVAERLLKRYWQAVSDVATALHASKSGCLTRPRLLRRLDRHFGSGLA